MSKRFLPIGGCLVALALLGGCRDEQGEGPMKPGIYGVDTGRAVFNKDGTYVEMADNQPKPVAEGKWWRKDGKLCTQPSTSDQAVCSEEKAVGTDGSFSLSSGENSREFKALVAN